MRRCTVVGVGLLLVAALVAGCARGLSTAGEGLEESASARPTADPTTSGSVPASPTGGAKASSSVTRTKGPLPAEMTLRGQVAPGVEAGCMVLTAEDGNAYLLLGGDRQVIAGGGRLEVVGEAQPGLMTTCQQGIAFNVTQVRRI